MRIFAILAAFAVMTAPALSEEAPGAPQSWNHGPVISLQPPAQQAPSLDGVEVTTEAVSTSPTHSGQAALGYGMCLDSHQGLPGVEERLGRLVILWRCHGRDNQYVVLKDGVLFLGRGQVHRIEPMAAPVEGCNWRETQSQERAYAAGVCRDEASEAARFVAEYPDARNARLASSAGPGATPVMAGTPLMAVPVREDDPVAVTWEYLPQTQHLRIVGTDLCLTPPSKDLTEGAPLYLDACAAPYTLVAHERRDGPRRARVRFDLFWR